MAKILIIDDDERLAGPLKEFFARYDFELFSANHPGTGLEILRTHPFDLVILDVMLPGMNGFDVCKTIRNQSDVPIVMLTARGDVMDRVQGLELGADDYLAKPFEPRELVARIQNILKRTEPATPAPTCIEFENLKIDHAMQQVLVDDEEIKVTSNEFQLLWLFACHPGQQLSRDDISNKLRGANVEIFSRAVDIQVSRLRQKLQPTDYIKTVWGVGYQFIAPQN